MSLFEPYLIPDLASIVLEYSTLYDRMTMGGDELAYDNAPIHDVICLRKSKLYLLNRLTSIIVSNYIPDIIKSKSITTIICKHRVILQCPNLKSVILGKFTIPLPKSVTRLTTYYEYIDTFELPLTHLDISYGSSSTHDLSRFDRLRKLNITIYAPCVSGDISGVLPNLEELNITTYTPKSTTGTINLNELTKLKKVVLSKYKINISYCSLLTSITLVNYQYPIDFTNFPNLAYLNIDKYYKHAVDLSKCTLLETLIVNSDLVTDISEFKFLTELHIGVDIPMSQLQNIQMLTLSHIPDTISGLMQLKSLTFDNELPYNIRLSNLPKLSYIEVLYHCAEITLNISQVPVTVLHSVNSFNGTIIISELRELTICIDCVCFNLDITKTVIQNLDLFHNTFDYCTLQIGTQS